MNPRPRICPACRREVPRDAEVRYTTAGIYHETCYAKDGGRRR